MPFAPEDAPLAHLSDQVMVAAALDKALDGTALWVLLGLYRAYAVLDRDQAEEVACIGLSPSAPLCQWRSTSASGSATPAR